MKSRTTGTSLIALSLGLGLGLCSGAAAEVSRADVLTIYADIAAAKYEDSVISAQRLRDAVQDLVASPSPETLNNARAAWIAARVPYQQTEVYRFGNAIVDDWEGKVNAWPLDEGLIDYVDAAYGGASDANELAALNVIANPSFSLSGTQIDATDITPELLSETLHEADGIEANVATGYHANEDAGLSAIPTGMGSLSYGEQAGERMRLGLMLERGNSGSEALIMGGVDGLIGQTRSIERVVTALGLDGIAFEGADSLNNPNAVFQ